MQPLTKLKNITGKRVLVRCDFDVPLTKAQIKNKKFGRLKRWSPAAIAAETPAGHSIIKVADDSRLRKCLPTIEYLLNKKAKIILIGHLGRPAGKVEPELSLAPVREKLEELLRQDTRYKIQDTNKSQIPNHQSQLGTNFKFQIKLINIERYIGMGVKKAVMGAKNGEILMLENLRFSDREEANCKRFAKNLAGLADLYVNESFANSHRAHASMAAIQKYLPSYAGSRLSEEIKQLSQVMNKPKRPLLLIIGGAKTETKIPVIRYFLNKADYIILGGAVANTFLKAYNYDLGESKFDPKQLAPARRILRALKANRNNLAGVRAKSQAIILNSKFFLPIDLKLQNGRLKDVTELNDSDQGLDIGPQTTIVYQCIIRHSRTIIWNGPMGKFEQSGFDHGTLAAANAIMLNQSAKVIIGGGDTDAALKPIKFGDNVFISSGGGAMLSFLSGQGMPLKLR